MEFLIEIGTEEIPAGFLDEVMGRMCERLGDLLNDNRLEHEKVTSTVTPRRLVATVSGLVDRQPDIVEERRGPSVKAAYDKDGNPTRAAVGFAKGAGIEIEELEKIETPKGDYLVAKIKKNGKKTIEVLADILPGFITNIYWRKSMRWGDGDLRFARPIHWILALLDGKVVKFEVDGVKSGTTTTGHRFAAPGKFEVTGFQDYKDKLHHAYVIVDHHERHTTVSNGVKDRAQQLGGEPACRDELIEEITNLVEWPVVIDAEFPERYLEIPDEVLIASMTGHQRYVPLRGKDGKLLPRFITVANTPASDLGVVARGNARVLNARLADAEFFYKADRKKSLEEHAAQLDDVLYIKGMGSYADKSKRIEKLAGKVAAWIAPSDDAVAERSRRAAILAKADLVTLMVGEFPSLQGRMGGVYALGSGEPKETATAIEEHYLPRSAADIDEGVIPKSKEGCAVAIADRADNLAACFALGLLPKGDQDPYALRRAVLGIMAIIKGLKLHIPMIELLDAAVAEVIDNSKKKKEELIDELTEFVRERIRHQLISDGAAHDTAEAVLRGGIDDYLEVTSKARALGRFRDRADFDDLATSFRRVGNILESFHKDSVDESLFKEDGERELWKTFGEKRDKVSKLASAGEYLEALEVMAELRPAVDGFFDEVLVNDPKDPKRRDNRHSMLYAIHRAFLAVADFSAIAKPGE